MAASFFYFSAFKAASWASLALIAAAYCGFGAILAWFTAAAWTAGLATGAAIGALDLD